MRERRWLPDPSGIARPIAALDLRPQSSRWEAQSKPLSTFRYQSTSPYSCRVFRIRWYQLIDLEMLWRLHQISKECKAMDREWPRPLPERRSKGEQAPRPRYPDKKRPKERKHWCQE